MESSDNLDRCLERSIIKLGGEFGEEISVKLGEEFGE